MNKTFFIKFSYNVKKENNNQSGHYYVRLSSSTIVTVESHNVCMPTILNELHKIRPAHAEEIEIDDMVVLV